MHFPSHPPRFSGCNISLMKGMKHEAAPYAASSAVSLSEVQLLSLAPCSELHSEPLLQTAKSDMPHARAAISSGETSPSTHCIGGWVDPTASPDDIDKRKISFPYRQSNPDSSVIHPIS
jgi:hypothetical protein